PSPSAATPCVSRQQPPPGVNAGARINSLSPDIISTPLAQDEMSGPFAEGYRTMIRTSAAGRMAPQPKWLPPRRSSSVPRVPSSPARTSSWMVG
ncbi:short-Chain dehydrogenase, partial [Arthrobacter sp. Hiyo6]